MRVVDVTARDGALRAVPAKERARLFRIVDECFQHHFGSAAAFFAAHRAVGAAMARLSRAIPALGPYVQEGAVADAVLQSLCDNLRKPVRDALMTHLVRTDVVRVALSDVGSTATRSSLASFEVFPQVFRYESACDAPLTEAQRRRVYAELARFVAPLKTLLETVDLEAVARDVHARVRNLEGVLFGVDARVPSGVAREAEHGRDSFRVVHEGDGDATRGDAVVAEVSAPAHAPFHRRHHVYRDARTLQHNFMVELPVTLLLRGRAVEVPISFLDWTITARDAHWSVLRERDAIRGYTVSPLGYELRYYDASTAAVVKACAGLAAQAGVYYAFACAHRLPRGSARETRAALLRVDAFCARASAALPQLADADDDAWRRFRRVVGPLWEAQTDERRVQMAPKARVAWLRRREDGTWWGRAHHVLAHDFCAALRDAVDALIASHVLGREQNVTYVSPVTIEDTVA